MSQAGVSRQETYSGTKEVTAAHAFDVKKLETYLADRIAGFHRQHGELWEPAPLLRQLAESGRTFASWDADQEKRFSSQ